MAVGIGQVFWARSIGRVLGKRTGKEPWACAWVLGGMSHTGCPPFIPRRRVKHTHGHLLGPPAGGHNRTGSEAVCVSTASACGLSPCGLNPCGLNPCGLNPCGLPCPQVPLNLRLASEPQRQVELTVHVDRRGKPQQPGATAAAGGGSSGEGGAGAAAGAAGGAGAAASS